jgi:hypothetical protein
MVDKRGLAAGVVILWAGVLMYDMQRLKSSPEFQSRLSPKGTSVTLFGREIGSDGACDGKR